LPEGTVDSSHDNRDVISGSHDTLDTYWSVLFNSKSVAMVTTPHNDVITALLEDLFIKVGEWRKNSTRKPRTCSYPIYTQTLKGIYQAVRVFPLNPNVG